MLKARCHLKKITALLTSLLSIQVVAIELDAVKLDELEKQVIQWRRDIHQHPELSNREFRTARLVANHLKSLGLDVTTEVAHTGVVGVLRGKYPGPVVALRADMDALPVTETVDLPFKSLVRTTVFNQEVGVMHACGHDAHVAILMGVAEILTGMRDQLRGSVKFLFQPAEEGAPEGEEGGAKLMIKEGALRNPDVDVVMGLHIMSDIAVNTLGYRSGGIMASSDDFRIVVKGASSHGSAPWSGVDPIVTSAQIVNALQTIVSRNLPLTKAAAVISVGAIHGGVRNNIIPEQVEMVGTIRALDPTMRNQVRELLHQRVSLVAQSMGAEVEIDLPHGEPYPVTYNNPELVADMLPVLRNTAGAQNVTHIDAITGSEDFSFFAERIPGFFFFLGGRPPHLSKEDAPSHHRGDFFIDESGMMLGVRALVAMTLAYQENHTEKPE